MSTILDLVKPVLVSPGKIVVTFILYGLTSFARAREKISTPALVALYAACTGSGITPPTDEILIMFPPLAFIYLIARLLSAITADKLVSTIEYILFLLAFSMVPAIPNPALLTKISI